MVGSTLRFLLAHTSQTWNWRSQPLKMPIGIGQKLHDKSLFSLLRGQDRGSLADQKHLEETFYSSETPQEKQTMAQTQPQAQTQTSTLMRRFRGFPTILPGDCQRELSRELNFCPSGQSRASLTPCEVGGDYRQNLNFHPYHWQRRISSLVSVGQSGYLSSPGRTSPSLQRKPAEDRRFR